VAPRRGTEREREQNRHLTSQPLARAPRGAEERKRIMQQKKQEKRQSEKNPQPGNETPPSSGISRRSILKNTTALTAPATFAAVGSNFAWAQVSEEIKVGVIGAAGRASGAVRDHTEAVKA